MGRPRKQLTGAELELLLKLFPTTFNAELEEIFGMCDVTLRKIANQHGVVKDMKASYIKRGAKISASTCGETNRKVFQKEKWRVEHGLPQLTHIHIPAFPYSRMHREIRKRARKAGYLPGSAFKEEERFVIYYTSETERSPSIESSGAANGITFREASERTR